MVSRRATRISRFDIPTSTTRKKTDEDDDEEYLQRRGEEEEDDGVVKELSPQLVAGRAR